MHPDTWNMNAKEVSLKIESTASDGEISAVTLGSAKIAEQYKSKRNNANMSLILMYIKIG
jgi:hypothetical protein